MTFKMIDETKQSPHLSLKDIQPGEWCKETLYGRVCQVRRHELSNTGNPFRVEVTFLSGEGVLSDGYLDPGLCVHRIDMETRYSLAADSQDKQDGAGEVKPVVRRFRCQCGFTNGYDFVEFAGNAGVGVFPGGRREATIWAISDAERFVRIGTWIELPITEEAPTEPKVRFFAEYGYWKFVGKKGVYYGTDGKTQPSVHTLDGIQQNNRFIEIPVP